MNYSPANIRIWSRLGSCGAFGMAAMELPAINDDIVMLTADLKFYSCLARFSGKYPDKFYNLGIAEQNMVGVAAGMAKEGMVPFASTYATFGSMRCADQVRVNMGYMNLNIKLVGLTAGYSVGILGPTHMSIEDIAVMRSIPNITILSPADCTETVKATEAAACMEGPVYLRLTGSLNNPIVYDRDYDFEIGKSILLKKGSDVAILATGTMVHQSLLAAELLEEQGISVSVTDIHTIKPLDEEAVKYACGAKLIVTAEEHSVLGGLGSAVAEVSSALPAGPALMMIGIRDRYPHAASYEFLLEREGLTGRVIADKILLKITGSDRRG